MPDAHKAAPAIPQKMNHSVIIKRDGKYAVRKDGGREYFAKADGTPMSAFEKKVAMLVEKKLNSGKVSDTPVEVAMNNTSGPVLRASVAKSSSAPKLLSPLSKVVESVRPELKWNSVDLADSYIVRIYDKSGNLVEESVLDGTSYVPSKLERGRDYVWQVGVRFNASDSWDNSKGEAFEVLADEGYRTLEKVRKEMPSSKLAEEAVMELYGVKDNK